MNKHAYLTILGLLFTIQSPAALHSLDGQETHGGNIVLSEFWNSHNQISTAFNNCPREQANPLVHQWLQQNIRTEVRTQEKVFVGAHQEQEVVASNEPGRVPPLILISETRWPLLSSLEKMRITIHETLPILGILDNDYLSSAKVLESYKSCTTSRVATKDILRAIAFCDQHVIAQLEGPEVFSVDLVAAMYNAAYSICAPALKKFEDFGGDVKKCYTPYYDATLESALEGFLLPYDNDGFRNAEVYDFFMSHSRTELASDCDPEFHKTCAKIKNATKIFPKAKMQLKALSLKIGCVF